MSLDAYQARDTQPETRHHIVRLLGTGASAPTKQIGTGITVTYVDVGRYLLTWADNPGTFIGLTYGLQAATPGDLAGHTVVADTYDSSAYALEVDLFNASDAAHDLAANEYLHLDIVFKLTGV